MQEFLPKIKRMIYRIKYRFSRQFCNARGIIVDQCIEEYGSGLNYNRKKWNKLLDEVMEQKIQNHNHNAQR